MEFNIFEFIYKVYDMLFQITEYTWNFLFEEVIIGLPKIVIFGVTLADWSFKFVPFWGIMAVLPSLFVLKLIKDFIPIA